MAAQQPKSRVSLLGACASEPTPHVRVPCPGEAHRCGEVCLICDEETDGTISIIVTEVELDALGCAAQGRPVPSNLSPRLHALGLLQVIEGIPVPTAQGYLLLGGGGSHHLPS